MKYCIAVLLLFLLVRGNAQSLFYARDKQTFLKELKGKSVADIRKELADASIELEDLAAQFKRLESLFDIRNNKTYTEATAKAIPPFSLPDARLVEEQFQATVKALEFEQQFILPDAAFEIRPAEQKGSGNYLRLNYRIKQLYKDGQSFREATVGLKRMDSLQATASYTVPLKMATVKIGATQKSAVYRNAKIYLDAVNKNHVSFRVDTAINDDLLEVYALTRGGKLVDHSGYMNTSNKNDGSTGKFFAQVILFLDGTVKDIDAGKFADQEALLANIEEQLAALKLPEPSPVNYKEYEFNGNVQTLVLYFREDKKTLRKDITAYNKDTGITGYNIFTGNTGKEGICDRNGNIVIEAQYNSLHRENDHYYYAEDKDYTQVNYYFDARAGKLVPLKGVEHINGQQHGMVATRRLIRKDTVNYDHEYKYSLYNDQGKQVIPEQYAFLEVVGNFVICRVTQDGKYGLLTLDGKVIAAPEYDELEQAADRGTGAVLPVIRVKKDKYYGLMSPEGTLLCPLQYDFIDFNEDRAVVSREQDETNIYGVMDIAGKLVVPIQYSYISTYADGMAVFSKDEKYGLLDKSGKVIVPARYNRMGDISDGMVVVRNEEDKYGAINNRGELVIPFRFREIKTFQAGYAFVFTENEYGIIDKTGKFMMHAPRPMSYGMSTNGEGEERTYQVNDKTYNYKGDLVPGKK